jgi:Uma2 family endonuclease
MATSSVQYRKRIDYPTSDGKPMAETDTHRDLMFDLIKRLDFRYEEDANVYVSGTLLLFYEEGNKRKHVSPDAFVVFGVKKQPRLNYLLWEEKVSPQFIAEITSSSTKNEDKKTKFVLYRDIIKVQKYFQFDPFGDYLKPRLQGFRLVDGDYVPIAPVDGRLPSEVLGLHLEARGEMLLLYDPATGKYIPTPEERAWQERKHANEQKERAEKEKERADRAEREKAELLAEIERLRQQKRNGA